ncbi:hypothetical protein [Limnobacter sp. P1]|uniref:hypothetical protein n=1 Tax=Limnobacter olei TaxID=3031298 RepID=UPI0023AFFB0D|nr:hypothetical protein [Limnobacter sp. P1]
MSIKLPTSRIANAQPSDLILQYITIGKKIIEIWSQAKFNKDRKVNDTVATIIRDCNGILGCGGNFKNGCLYRESVLDEIWTPRGDEQVICDHAIPVSELVRMYKEDNIQIEELIFYPVVRISQVANDNLTKKGFAKRGFDPNLPLLRYSKIDLKIKTHFGEEIDPKTWTIEQHTDLVRNTPELKIIIDTLRGGLLT